MGRPKGSRQPETRKISATVTVELYEAMEDLASQQGRTIPHLAAFALEYFMAKDAPQLYPLNKSARQYENEDREDEDE